MDLDKTMPETVAPEMPTPDAIAENAWLPDAALAVCVAEYQRIGFQGGLQWYRVTTSGQFAGEMELFAGRTIDVPSLYLSGKRDWGVFQSPGAYERMQGTACTDMRSCSLEGAGHWPDQEKPAETLAFAAAVPERAGLVSWLSRGLNRPHCE